eukprot:6669471-Alexandrium_andersonii.AAC.1
MAEGCSCSQQLARKEGLPSRGFNLSAGVQSSILGRHHSEHPNKHLLLRCHFRGSKGRCPAPAPGEKGGG